MHPQTTSKQNPGGENGDLAAVSARLAQEHVRAEAESKCRKMPFSDDIEGFILEAESGWGFTASHELSNDLFGLMLMRDLGDRFNIPVDISVAREALVRMRIAFRTGVYPRYLLVPL